MLYAGWAGMRDVHVSLSLSCGNSLHVHTPKPPTAAAAAARQTEHIYTPNTSRRRRPRRPRLAFSPRLLSFRFLPLARSFRPFRGQPACQQTFDRIISTFIILRPPVCPKVSSRYSLVAIFHTTTNRIKPQTLFLSSFFQLRRTPGYYAHAVLSSHYQGVSR